MIMTSKPQSSFTSQEEIQSEEIIYFSQALPQSPIQTQNDEEDGSQSATPTTSEASQIPKRRMFKRSLETAYEELEEHEKRLKTGQQQLATTPFPYEGALLTAEEKQVTPLSIYSASEEEEISSTPQTKEERVLVVDTSEYVLEGFEPVEEGCSKEESKEQEEEELEGTNPCGVSEEDVTLLFSRDLARLSRARDIVNYDIGKFKGLVAQGTTVKARIPGSFSPYYRVSVSLAPQQIERESMTPNQKVHGWRCSCPDGVVPCKHIGALLITWSRDPHRFVRTKTLSEVLERKTRDELLEMLLQVSRTNEQFEDQLLRAATGIMLDDDDTNLLDDYW